MLFSRRPFTSHAATDSDHKDAQSSEASGGQYVGEAGGNDAPSTYQDASGAPIETSSPLGYSVGPVTILFLNISMMIGTGIFSTRSLPSALSMQVLLEVLTPVPSVRYSGRHGLRWPEYDLLGARRCHLSLRRRRVSGIRLVFPESVRRRGRLPRTGLPSTTLLLPDDFCYAELDFVFSEQQCHWYVSPSCGRISLTMCLVLSNYLFATAGVVPTDWQTKGVALAGYTVAFFGECLTGCCRRHGSRMC